MENVLHYILGNAGAVTAITEDRIFPVYADWSSCIDRESGTLKPCIVYHRDDTSLELDIRNTPHLFVASFTVDYYAETFLEEWQLGNAIFVALHNQQGSYNGSGLTTIKFQGRQSLDDVDNEGRFVFHGSQQYRIVVKGDFAPLMVWDIDSGGGSNGTVSGLLAAGSATIS